MKKDQLRRGEQGEQIILSLLENDKSIYHKVISNLILLGNNGMTHQIDFIDIRPNGIFVIEAKNIYGKLEGKMDDDFWHRTYLKRGQLVKEKITNPIKQNSSHIRIIKKNLKVNYPFFNIIALVQNNADELGIFKVCNLTNLISRISMMEDDITLTNNEINNIYQNLLSLEAYTSEKEHLSNIKKMKEDKDAFVKESIYAIENRKCPRCQNSLILHKDTLCCNKCGYFLKIN